MKDSKGNVMDIHDQLNRQKKVVALWRDDCRKIDARLEAATGLRAAILSHALNRAGGNLVVAERYYQKLLRRWLSAVAKPGVAA